MPTNDYIVTIGLEVHCQIRTLTKMFCACRAGYGFEPNTNVCPTCLGMPGALPVLNEYAIQRTIQAGLLLDCHIPDVSKWDRKNYFYPDMPKNYQTSQQELPLCIGGSVPLYAWAFPHEAQAAFGAEGIVRRVKLDHIHLEEDAAKLTHFAEYSLVDYNRGGTPLMEIVSAPDITSPDEAYAYLKSLQQIMVCTGISHADMEKGEMRCDVNVSLRPRNQEKPGAKIEIKNINSASAVRRALIFEIERQAEELDAGKPQMQATRRWDDTLGATITMRIKENAHDYRYHTCPDLLPIHTAPFVEKARAWLPELPHERRARLMQHYGLQAADADTLVTNAPLFTYFEEVVRAGAPARKAANWVINILPAIPAKDGSETEICPVSPATLAGVIHIVENGDISANQGKDVLNYLQQHTEQTAEEAAACLGYKRADSGALEQLITRVLEENPDMVKLVRAGNMKLVNALTGKIMKAAGSKPNPRLVTELLLARLQV